MHVTDVAYSQVTAGANAQKSIQQTMPQTYKIILHLVSFYNPSDGLALSINIEENSSLSFNIALISS